MREQSNLFYLFFCSNRRSFGSLLHFLHVYGPVTYWIYSNWSLILPFFIYLEINFKAIKIQSRHYTQQTSSANSF